jgi:hypothetical protein
LTRLGRTTKYKSENPKLKGSGIIDCIPQTGYCPNGCLECYYNGGNFFTDRKTPLLPSVEEVGEKLVRVNSGHDSNLQKDLVLKSTSRYEHRFYNTSLPNFDFPAPVVFTCNGRDTDNSALMVVKGLENVMHIRFRTNLWNLDLLEEVIFFYTHVHYVPVTITFMRYTDIGNIPLKFREYYDFRKSILNMYYCLCKEKMIEISEKYAVHSKIVGTCGTVESSYCKDCGRCVWSYSRMENKFKWGSLLEV